MESEVPTTACVDNYSSWAAGMVKLNFKKKAKQSKVFPKQRCRKSYNEPRRTDTSWVLRDFTTTSIHVEWLDHVRIRSPDEALYRLVHMLAADFVFKLSHRDIACHL